MGSFNHGWTLPKPHLFFIGSPRHNAFLGPRAKLVGADLRDRDGAAVVVHGFHSESVCNFGADVNRVSP